MASINNLNVWGQFHQPFGAYRKCGDSHYLAQISFTNKIMPNSTCKQYKILCLIFKLYSLHSMQYVSKIIVNLLLQKLLFKWCWNWPLVIHKWRHTFVMTFFEWRYLCEGKNKICFFTFLIFFDGRGAVRGLLHVTRLAPLAGSGHGACWKETSRKQNQKQNFFDSLII